jgi:hypothetical protein
VKAAVVFTFELSEASTVNVNVPLRLGVPVIAPELERLSPSGKDPLVRTHVYGAMPPVTASVVEYAELTNAFGNGDAVVIVRLVGIEMEIDCVADIPVLSVTFTTKLKIPVAVGVPDMVPAEDSVKPGGSCPLATAHV